MADGVLANEPLHKMEQQYRVPYLALLDAQQPLTILLKASCKRMAVKMTVSVGCCCKLVTDSLTSPRAVVKKGGHIS
jgi:hypothetical protein